MRFPILLVLLAGCVTSPPPMVEYSVVRGDTLGEIATAHGVSVDELREWNGLQGDLIEVGQVLRIGAPSAPAPEDESGRNGAPSSRPQTRSAPAASAPSEPTLRLPAEKPCRPPPSFDDAVDVDGLGTVASQGLTKGEINAAIDGFLHKTTSCANEDWSGTLQVELNIACSGRVTAVEVVSDGGAPMAVSSCVAERLRFAPFPAHALPNGERVRIPLSYRYTPPAPEGTAEP
ncbi:MAG: LysM peptidoglycan-binding domain-containing protein [Myxococcota bacterium]